MEKNNNDLFELITKMYNEMKNDIKNLDNKFDNLDTKIANLDTKVDNLDTKVDNLDTKVDNLENKMNKRFDDLTSDIGNLVSKDIAQGISNQIVDIKTDIGFVKHKLNATEEDVYKIQSQLKIVK